MNEFNYLRMILVSDSTEALLKAYKSLSNEGLEVYVKNNDKGIMLFNEKRIKPNDIILVPACDWEFALEILLSVGLGDYVTECEALEETKTDVEIARDKFYKKRKWTYIETAVIIVIAMLYYLFKTLFR